MSPSEAAPLVIYLHGYGARASQILTALRVEDVANTLEFLYAIPEGTPDPTGRRFWNATPACCNFHGAPIDDVAYLESIIDDVMTKAKVDERRIFVVGFSNGGFMAHRAACELNERVAAVAAIAGVTFFDEDRCRPSQPVSILQIHGRDDDVVSYNGGHTLGRPDAPPHPSAPQTVARWSRHNGCDAEPTPGENFDLDEQIPGAETSVLRYPNCKKGSAVELWTVAGGNHFVALGEDATRKVYRWLEAHPKPP